VQAGSGCWGNIAYWAEITGYDAGERSPFKMRFPLDSTGMYKGVLLREGLERLAFFE